MNCSQKKVLKRKTSVWNMFAPSESRFGFTSFNRKSTLKRQKHVLSWNVTSTSSVRQQCQTKNGVVCPSICCHDLQPWEMSKHTREYIACTLFLSCITRRDNYIGENRLIDQSCCQCWSWSGKRNKWINQSVACLRMSPRILSSVVLHFISRIKLWYIWEHKQIHFE